MQYWQCRLEVFGPDKYLLTMALDGALQDDIAAIEDGVACKLPQLDASGRQILYMEPHRRNASKSYSSQSLVSTD